jgi:CBS domain-containing protein
MATVRDLMRSGVVTCGPGTLLGEAAALLVEHQIHAIVVLGDDGLPAGVLADSDLLAGEWLAGNEGSLAALRGMTAGELMTPAVETIDAAAPAADAAATLHERRIARLVVVDDDRPVGVLAISDVVRHMGSASAGRRTVADVMSRGFVACRPDAPASAVARAMTERRSRSVVVLDSDGRPLGVVTGHDLLPLAASGSGDVDAAALMNPPVTIGLGADLRQAADALVTAEVHRLVVVDEDEPESTPVGIISTWDILVEMASPESAWR